MARTALAIAVALALASGAASTGLHGNPIRKVVTMLQDMQKSVESEGEKEKELFDKFMCYCNNGAGALDAAIQTGQQQITQLTSQVEAETAQKSQLEQDVTQHKADRVEAEKTIKESTAMREKEAAEFASTSGEMRSNIEAMGGALAALKKGLSASFLQTQAGSMVRNIILHSPAIRAGQRDMLLSFLDSGVAEEGSTDTIIGIVDQMRETMEGDLKEETQTEDEAKADFTTLMTSKESEIAAAGKAIEEKTARVGELAVSIVQAKNDNEDTKEALEEDTTFKANLASQCASKSKEWDARQKIRAEELQCLSEVIEMLNGDDALELFKKTLPSAAASLLEVSSTTTSQRRRAEMLLRSLQKSDRAHGVSMRMMLLALKSKTGGFGKVVEMVDGMIAAIAKEQADDDAKKDFCVAELAKSEDEVKALAQEISDLEVSIAEKEDGIATLASEIKALQDGIAALDKSAAQATEQRKEEHEEYASTAAANSAALELIGMAKNRMNKFYAPSQYKAPETTTESSSPYGFVQLSSRARAAPGPAPEMPSGEYKKSESSGGVMAMMDQMLKDVEMDMQEAKHDEEDAQKDYEETMKDAATKRSEDSKLIVEKEGAKAEQTMSLEATREQRMTKRNQHGIAQGKQDDLHKECDYLLANYDKMKADRVTESDGLKEAKAVLAGASAGFLQKKHV